MNKRTGTQQAARLRLPGRQTGAARGQACPEPCRREEAERLDAAIAENLTALGYGK